MVDYKCPTCGRPPSERISEECGYGGPFRDECEDPIHDLADRAPELEAELAEAEAASVEFEMQRDEWRGLAEQAEARCAELEAEVEKLRASFELLDASYARTVERDGRRIEKAEARCAEMRAALEADQAEAWDEGVKHTLGRLFEEVIRSGLDSELTPNDVLSENPYRAALEETEE